MFNNELILKLIRAIKKNNSPISKVKELGEGENGVLQTLLFYERELKKDVTPGDLCSIQNLTSGRVASTLKNLERKKYIKRNNDSIDRRKILVRLTDEGRKIAKNISDKISKNIQNIIDKLGEKDFNELIRLLNLINSN